MGVLIADENEFAEMVKQIRDYLLGDFLELCIERGKWDDNTVLAFSDGGGSTIATHKHRKLRRARYLRP